jgi:hypothetical protein
MSTSSHPQSCRCRLHLQVEAARHNCYRQLAQAILGPAAPLDDRALAHALAEHALLTKPITNITPIQSRRAA